MIADIHIHTSPLSPDSKQTPEQAILQAKNIGLDCICFTEHNKAWDAEQAHQLSLKWGIHVMRGIEVDTVEGHILVFGIHRDFEGIIRAHELQGLVQEAGGVMIAAHPFKGFRAFGFSDLQLSLEQASSRPVFRCIDAVEGRNGRSLEKENTLAQDVAKALNLNITGGSDAHEINEIGRCVTIFENSVTSEAELITELKAGRFNHGMIIDGVPVEG